MTEDSNQHDVKVVCTVPVDSDMNEEAEGKTLSSCLVKVTNKSRHAHWRIWESNLGIFLIGKEGNSRILGLEAMACAWMEIGIHQIIK